MTTIRVLSPVAEVKVSQMDPLRLPSKLAGMAVGFLDNTTNSNFSLVARHMDRLLRERHAIGSAVHYRKPNAATPAPSELLAAVAHSVNLVVTGAAD